MPSSSASTLGPYQILGLIGSGAMGEVYRARDARLGREVALKIIRSEAGGSAARQRFEHEARAVGQLNHPNIVTIHDVGHDDGKSWIVTELVEGETLRAIIRRGPVPLRRLLDIAIQIAEGLAAAHAAGVVHRDLKPDNVMIARDGRVKILDFGLAKPLLTAADGESEAALDSAITAPGILVGTAAYVSPEQARGEQVSYYADQFSLGVILYEMATGELPFRGDTPLETLAQILREPAPEAAVGPVPFRWLIMRCLHKEPDHRYASTADIVRELSVVRDHVTQTPTAEQTRAALHERSNRFSSRRLLIALLFLATAAAGFLFARVLGAGRAPDRGGDDFLPYAGTNALELFPALAPNGQTVAWAAEVGGTFQILVRSTSAFEPTQLTHAPADCLHPFWSPDGARVYYVSEAYGQPSLWSVGTTGGAPQLMLQDVTRAAVARDGRTFALLRSDGRLWLGEPGGTLKRCERGPFRSATFLPWSFLRFTPDGVWLGAWLALPSGRSQFWRVPLGQGEPERILHNLTSPVGRQFDWLPDSRHVVFGQAVSGSSHLWLADTRSGRVSPLTSGTGNELAPSVAPDGRTIAFSSTGLDYDVVSVPLSGGDLETVESTTAFELSPAVAGAGELAFVTDRRGSPEIWFAERPLVTQEHFGMDPTILMTDLVFSPGGRRLAFRRVGSRDESIWIATIAGDPPVRLVSEPGNAPQRGPTWSPDGNWIAYYSIHDGHHVLERARPGSVEPPQVIRADAGTDARWSPRGDWIATIAHGQGLQLISADGGRQRSAGSGSWLVHGWSTDGRTIRGLRLAGRRLASVSLDVETGREAVIADLGPQPASFTYGMAVGSPPAVGFALSADGRSFLTSVIRLDSDIWLLRSREPARALAHLKSH
ncbi:MAG TPA: protein kinase [Bryobacteraceae bacterium]|nr:protein kinase [Bryobacteraceae bacterium]